MLCFSVYRRSSDRIQNDLIYLLKTGDECYIVENSTRDYYWGCGKDKTGKNRLGVLLMMLRSYLHSQYEVAIYKTDRTKEGDIFLMSIDR